MNLSTTIKKIKLMLKHFKDVLFVVKGSAFKKLINFLIKFNSLKNTSNKYKYLFFK
ncbi:hypothetical protein SAMN04487979_104236 [Flavobacterium sp. ov086]|nr:hypothetical protein SAMN04487979_104236 [Flavobacterium sp. ov086]